MDARLQDCETRRHLLVPKSRSQKILQFNFEHLLTINQLAHYANICIKSGKLSEAVVQEMNQWLGELIKIEIKLKDAMRKILESRLSIRWQAVFSVG